MGITRNPEIMHGTGVLSAENTLARPFKTSQKTALRALFLRPERFFTPKKRQKTSKMPPAVDYRGIFDQKKYAVKEPDPETGLYYYGARYLDPKTSRWISGDPALGDYLPSAGRKANDLPGMGGVYNTINLHTYHYAGNNPVKYVDPDGLVLIISGSNSYKREVMSYLRKIDPNVRISWSTGIVTTTKNNTPGSKLISGLQLSNNTVTIQKGNTSHKPESHENSAVAGVGTDSIVYFSSDNIQEGNYYLKDNSGNFYIAGSQPLEIVLGHELIHGLHAAEGTRDISWDDYAYPIDGNYDGRHQSGDTVLSRSTGTGFPREEAKTIGVGEYRDNEITENALRKQRGYDERVNH